MTLLSQSKDCIYVGVEILWNNKLLQDAGNELDNDDQEEAGDTDQMDSEAEEETGQKKFTGFTENKKPGYLSIFIFQQLPGGSYSRSILSIF